MTLPELICRWTDRRDLLKDLGGGVNGAKVINKFLSDLYELSQSERDTLLTLREASELSGYSCRHLGRLIRQGVIYNAGRHNAPKIRIGDLPFRSPGLRKNILDDKFETARSRIAKSVITRFSKGITDETDKTI